MTSLDWTLGVHHDGSALYVSNLYPTLDDIVTIRLRVPKTAPLLEVTLRTSSDGEQHDIPMEREAITGDASPFRIYSGNLSMRNRTMRYRFKLLTEDDLWYFTGMGMSRIEWPAQYSFKLVAGYQAPEWIFDAVFYQIFPDRFYNSNPALNPVSGVEFNSPDGRRFTTQLRDWELDAPLPYAEGGMVDFFGGDLPGISEKLDYLNDLGVNALYLNPIFSSMSNHKYNVNDYFTVDPHFGGNTALAELRSALDDVNFRIVLDLTPNHTGNDHTWFKSAQADFDASTTAYYTFHDHPHHYESWLGIPTLPKLNYANQQVWDAMIHSENSVIKHWLQEPYRIDGWRLDVWNMTGRQGGYDANHSLATALVQAAREANPDAFVFGESFFDAVDNLQGDQLDAVMNYRGFTTPLWRWLGGCFVGDPPLPEKRRHISATEAVEQMQHYYASIPWIIARQQFNLLGSHDTQRILAVVGDDHELAKVAATLLFTFPGVPCVYYGDEIGMTGTQAKESHRMPMQWNEEQWDDELYSFYKQLIHLRRQSDALINGGYQVLYAAADVLVYQRHSQSERLIILLHRGRTTATPISIPVWQAGVADDTAFDDVILGNVYTCQAGELQFDKLAHGQVLILREQA